MRAIAVTSETKPHILAAVREKNIDISKLVTNASILRFEDLIDRNLQYNDHGYFVDYETGYGGFVATVELYTNYVGTPAKDKTQWFRIEYKPHTGPPTFMEKPEYPLINFKKS